MKLMGDKHPRHKAALQPAVEKSGYGKRALPLGAHWGVAVHESFESVVAYVVEASVKDGKPVIHNVTAGEHCKLCVNPRTIEAQVQGSAIMALGTTMPGHAITLKDGAVKQSNFNDYGPARVTDAFDVAVHIVPSNDPPKGMGEPGLPPLEPALANAVRRATGKVQRELPLKGA
jgi:isoquinoline 1-oxidoreductase subunit beta